MCVSSAVKPSSPKDLSYRWHQDALTVTCPELPFPDMLYEVQHRSTFDSEWQVSAGRLIRARVTAASRCRGRGRSCGCRARRVSGQQASRSGTGLGDGRGAAVLPVCGVAVCPRSPSTD